MHDMRIPVAGSVLRGDIEIPEPVHGVVLFAHGSGSSRHSPRNRFVAEELRNAGLATVLVDLLTAQEERADAMTGALRFNIDLLAQRVAALTDWMSGHEPLAGLGLALFGASTGAAAALVAAAARPDLVRTVVSRGGRPDLAGQHLRSVRAPTLLIVGEHDQTVVNLNRTAMRRLAGEARLVLVPGASHLFEEPGALEQVARLAAGWLRTYLTREDALT
jgi:putative phosphoribosyl transferase